ncbi:MAG: hypothetical protein WCV69_02655 [Patescibacteria group bacterium]
MVVPSGISVATEYPEGADSSSSSLGSSCGFYLDWWNSQFQGMIFPLVEELHQQDCRSFLARIKHYIIAYY